MGSIWVQLIEKIPNFGEFSLKIIITGFDKILLILADLSKPKPRILDNRSIYFVANHDPGSSFDTWFLIKEGIIW